MKPTLKMNFTRHRINWTSISYPNVITTQHWYRQHCTWGITPSLIPIHSDFPPDKRHSMEGKGNLWLERLNKRRGWNLLSLLDILNYYYKKNFHDETTMFFHSPIALAKQEHGQFHAIDLILKVVRNEAHGTTFNPNSN